MAVVHLSSYQQATAGQHRDMALTEAHLQAARELATMIGDQGITGDVIGDRLTVTNFDSLFPNFTSEELPPDTIAVLNDGSSPEYDYRVNAGVGAYAGSWVRELVGGGGGKSLSHTIPCLPEDAFNLQPQTRRTAGAGNHGAKIEYLDKNNAVLSTFTDTRSSAAWVMSQVQGVAPAATVKVRFSLWVAAATTAQFDAIYARRSFGAFVLLGSPVESVGTAKGTLAIGAFGGGPDSFRVQMGSVGSPFWTAGLAGGGDIYDVNTIFGGDSANLGLTAIGPANIQLNADEGVTITADGAFTSGSALYVIGEAVSPARGALHLAPSTNAPSAAANGDLFIYGAGAAQRFHVAVAGGWSPSFGAGSLMDVALVQNDDANLLVEATGSGFLTLNGYGVKISAVVDEIDFQINGVTKAAMDAAGVFDFLKDVGLGTNDPDTWSGVSNVAGKNLQIKGGAEQTRLIINNSGASGAPELHLIRAQNAANDRNFRFYVDATYLLLDQPSDNYGATQQCMAWTKDGRVGIGRTDPPGTLHVKTTAGIAALTLGGANQINISFRNAADTTDKFLIGRSVYSADGNDLFIYDAASGKFPFIVGIGSSGNNKVYLGQGGSPGFAPGTGTLAPLNLQPVGVPGSFEDGDVWVENNAGTWNLKVRLNGATKTVTVT